MEFGTGPVIDRRTWEVVVVMTLRDRLRAGDIWVEGSRAFRAFDDFLLRPPRSRPSERLTNWGLPFPTALKHGATSVFGLLSCGFEKWQNWPLLGLSGLHWLIHFLVDIQPLERSEASLSQLYRLVNNCGDQNKAHLRF
jgi:hypothetical protein